MFNELMQSLTNLEIFKGSIVDFMQNISVSSVIMSVIVIFMLVGLVDKLRSRRDRIKINGRP